MGEPTGQEVRSFGESRMSLREKNRRIEIAGEDAIEVVRTLGLVLVSLHKIGSYYAVPKNEAFDTRSYEHETTRFIDEWKVTSRLATARKLLSVCFDLTLGEDDMDDLERECESIDYWSGPGSSPSEKASRVRQ
jgi:hypothetical protein